MAKKKVTKKMMLDELMSIITEYNQSLVPIEDEDGNKTYPKSNVKTADKINSIKTICQLEGFFEPTVSKIIQEIEIEF